MATREMLYWDLKPRGSVKSVCMCKKIAYKHCNPGGLLVTQQTFFYYFSQILPSFLYSHFSQPHSTARHESSHLSSLKHTELQGNEVSGMSQSMWVLWSWESSGASEKERMIWVVRWFLALPTGKSLRALGLFTIHQLWFPSKSSSCYVHLHYFLNTSARSFESWYLFTHFGSLLCAQIFMHNTFRYISVQRNRFIFRSKSQRVTLHTDYIT